MFKTALLYGAVVAGTFSSMAMGADLVVMGKAAPIVVFKDAPPRTREAAVVLADYVEKISGARPEVVDGEPQPIPEGAIWVGVQPAVKGLFPKTDFDFKHPEEIVLAANEKHVVIAGRDRWDPAHMEAKTKEGVIQGVQLEYGTVNAVYTFLQDQLGVRWFWPGELGEDVPKRETVSVAPFEYRYHPQIRCRTGVFHYSALGEKGYGKAHEWTLKQRLQLDSLEMEGGHGFGDWWERYHETHPEVFALQPDGTRSGFPNPRTVKICASNPKVWELWLKQVDEELAANPNQWIFNASPNDGWASGHCVCENCRAWDHPDGEPRLFHWQNQHEEHPALSDRDVTFANKLGELLKAKYPGKDYRVMMLSYGHSRPAPIKARPAENVFIASVANFLGRTGLVDRGSTRGDTFRQQFDAWAKLEPRPNLVWRPNTGSPAGWQQGLPDISTTQTIADLKAVAAANCQGIFIDSVWEHWATMGPQYYAMAQLAWNPAVDGEAVLKDYYERAFGSAAEAVRAYFELMERERMAFTKENLEASVFEFPKLYTEALSTEAQGHLDRAAKAVAADSVQARRVAFVQAGLDYTKLVVENARLMEGYWKKKDAAVAAQVKENWKAIEAVVAKYPHAINEGPVRAQTPRMAGLHPDYAPKKEKKAKGGKKADDLDLN